MPRRRTHNKQAALNAEQALDVVLRALADHTRRRMLQRLARGPATVTEFAKPLGISLPAVSRHLRILEDAGFVHRTVEGRTHYCFLNLEPIQHVDAFTQSCRALWMATLESLGIARLNDSREIP